MIKPQIHSYSVLMIKAELKINHDVMVFKYFSAFPQFSLSAGQLRDLK